MKYLNFFVILLLYFFLFTTQAKAQTSCARILSVASSVTELSADSLFTCTARVDSAHAGSQTIACGISFDGKYPENYCPSDTGFGGWNGDTASFNCNVSAAALSTKPITIELVAFDFSPHCGLSTALKSTVKISSTQSSTGGQNGNSSSTGSSSSEGSSTSQSGGSSNTSSSKNPSGTGNSGGIGQGVIPNNGSQTSSGISIHTFFQDNSTSYSQNLNSQAQLCLKNKAIYQAASQETGVPWEVLAAIHFKEGSCGENTSLVSGRTIGTNEPDVDGNCSQTVEKGKPYAFAEGCAFASVLDSAIYSGNHLKGKIGSQVPSTVPELVMALSKYNGGGNANCGQSPYSNCPALYYGEDDSYVMNLLDARHATMYTIYCGDGARCSVPQVDQRPGTFTLSAVISKL